jgi:DNA-binding beta-propeller fold protein YncE
MGSRRLLLLVLLALGVLVAVVPAAASAAAQVKSLSTFGKFGTAAGEIRQPGGAEYAADGDYYVVDKGNARIDVFGPDGAFKFTFGKAVNKEDDSDLCKAGEPCKPGDSGPLAGELAEPEDLVLYDHQVYVTEAKNNRVSVFSEAGKFLFAFGDKVGKEGGNRCDAFPGCRAGVAASTSGAMNEPSGIAVSSQSAFAALYIADRKNNRVDSFQPNGTFRFAFGTDVGGKGIDSCSEPRHGSPPCQVGKEGSDAGSLPRPGALTIDQAEESVYVASTVNNRIDVYDINDQYRYSFGLDVTADGADRCTEKTGCVKGSSSFEAGSLPNPTAIAVVEHPYPEMFAEFYVADAEAARVSKFIEQSKFLHAWGEGVLDGSRNLQVCEASCRRGRPGTDPGAINAPSGLAVDRLHHIAVTEGKGHLKEDFAQVELFGEGEADSNRDTDAKGGKKTAPQSLLLNPF